MIYTPTEDAKSKAIYISVEYLRQFLDGDITDPVERVAYQKEIKRLLNQQDKINQRARARA